MKDKLAEIRKVLEPMDNWKSPAKAITLLDEITKELESAGLVVKVAEALRDIDNEYLEAGLYLPDARAAINTIRGK